MIRSTAGGQGGGGAPCVDGHMLIESTRSINNIFGIVVNRGFEPWL